MTISYFYIEIDITIIEAAVVIVVIRDFLEKFNYSPFNLLRV